MTSQVMNVNDIILDVASLLERLIGEDVRLTIALDPELRLARVDPTQIEQIVMNLTMNGRDAMPKGGLLTIETANVDVADANIEAWPSIIPGPYATLAVRDTGIGLDEAAKASLFEQVLTAETPAKDTGLGLAMVCGIVKQSGGCIQVESAPGHGATFRIYLPAVEEDRSEAQSPDARAERREAQGGTETVLLVEDEVEVRAVLAFFLEGLGYRVLQANDGDEAIQIFDNYGSDIQLLVTDVVMPNKGGRELVEHLSTTFKGLRVIYMSGYADDAVLRHGVQQGEVDFLQKPFPAAELAAKVRQVLDR